MKDELSEFKEEALEFLNNHRKMVMTVLDENKHPNSSLLLYAVDDDFNVYFGTCKCFGKYSALKADPHLSLAVVQEEINPVTVVDMQGKAEELLPQEVEVRLDWFCKKNPAEFYIKGREDFTMFKVVPHKIRWADASSGTLEIHDLKI